MSAADWIGWFFAIAPLGVFALMGLWTLYALVKAAVREGIRESGLIEEVRRAGFRRGAD
ncbi:hypothetical protein [Polaromonas sp.]|uniref:hypothetical protein n=1 Tax=Polaromonas sp. TaxID=1869339 RepID=UPI003CC64CDB